MTAGTEVSPMAFFETSWSEVKTVLGFLQSEEAGHLSHSEVEDYLAGIAPQLMRIFFQDHLTLRALREQRIKDVVDAGGVARNSVEPKHERSLTTIFGDVTVTRLAYRQRGYGNLYPADALLNLPSEQYSLGLRRQVAIEACRGSFGDAVEAIERNTGARLGKRQVEELTERAAADFESFYANSCRREQAKPEDVLVLSADGKGIIMRTGALRDATAKAAQSTEPWTRLSQGEKKNRKRMAEVGAVYYATPVPRTPRDILQTNHNAVAQAKPAPVAKDKWLTASVVENAATVISQVFAEAERRDPEHQRTWVVLVDGNNHQIDCIAAEAQKREVSVNIVIDFIHVLEYVWKAARSFFNEHDPAAEAWVAEKAIAILAGKAGIVAGSIARKATDLKLDLAKRQGADDCHDYLEHKKPYLNYDIALEQGWPIATGVIEGAVRYLVKDRMDITGARWGLDGAEAVLKLRALRKNGDFVEYWSYHVAQELQRVHKSRYANGVVPQVS